MTITKVKKGWQITDNGKPINAGYVYKEQWKAEAALKNIEAFRRSRGNKK